jgi:hypothetical protein
MKNLSEKLRSDLYFVYPLENNLIEIYMHDIIPESLSYDYSPNYSGKGTLGRMSPIQIYSGGSAKVYSFNLTIHEDMMINTNYDNIIDFVDAIKSLSYPTISKEGILKKPQVEFHLGELSGLGIVKTSINWRKPFRDGRYILADISFNITVEEVLPSPEVEEIVIEEDTETIITYSSKYKISRYYEEFFGDRLNVFTDQTSDFVTWDPSDEEKLSNIRFTAQEFNYAEELFSQIFNNFTVDEVSVLDETSLGYLTALQESVGSLGEVISNLNSAADDVYTHYNRNSSVPIYIFQTDIESNLENGISVLQLLDNIEQDFKTFLDDYYDNVDLEMSEDQYNRAVQEVEIYIDNMRDMFKEVYSYAPSN